MLISIVIIVVLLCFLIFEQYGFKNQVNEINLDTSYVINNHAERIDENREAIKELLRDKLERDGDKEGA